MLKIITFFCFMTIFSGRAQNNEEMLLGKISLSDLQEAPYLQWFESEYESYVIDNKSAEKLKTLLEGIKVKVFMGTWCPDSQREVPRFYKIMDTVGFPIEDIQLVAIDREKRSPDQLEKSLDIIRVPTFIFYRDNKELGRIVEYPIQSLEADMVQILSGKDYEHAYEE